ncbi:MAG: nucleotide exchange factor GrpE [Gammaproteobacteria bacterium]|jgi:molecular chaperone GrpE
MTKEQQTVANTGGQEHPRQDVDEISIADPTATQQQGEGEEQQSSQGEAAAAKKAGAQTQPGKAAGTPSAETLEPAQAAEDKLRSLEEVTQVLEDTKRKAEGHWNALLRSQAELENLRKRSAREVENARKFGLERFAAELLPVKDSLELGVAAAQDESVSLASVREGMDLTLKMLKTTLEKFGIEEIAPHDEPFNPEFHEAMSVQETDRVPSGTVLTVVQKGYLLNGRLVRPAMVIVAK